MVATAGLLRMAGVAMVARGYWSEHSERTVLSTGLALKPIPPADWDMLGRCKLEGSE